MCRWLSLGLVMFCGCVSPLADFRLLESISEPARPARHTVTDNLPTPLTGATPDKETATRHSDQPSTAGAQPHAPSAAGMGTQVIDRATARPPAEREVDKLVENLNSNLSAEHQQYLRDQLLALLNPPEAAAPGARANDTATLPVQTHAVPAMHASLPGPADMSSLDPKSEQLFTAANRIVTPPNELPPGNNSSTAAIPREGRVGSVYRGTHPEQRAPAKEPTTGPSEGGIPSTHDDAASAAGGAGTAQASAAEPVDSLRPGQWRATLATALSELEKDLVRFPHDEREAAMLAAYVRLLNVVGNNRGAAVAAIEKLPDDEREYWTHQLYALLYVLDAEQKHAPARRAALALRELRSAAEQLANASTLDVRNLAFCSAVESYGRYTEFRTQSFRAGQEVLLYVEVDNFTAEQVRDKFATALYAEYSIFDSSGQRINHSELPFVEQICNNRPHDYFIAYNLFLPKDLRPGQYSLQLTVEDVKGRKSSDATIEFGIR